VRAICEGVDNRITNSSRPAFRRIRILHVSNIDVLTSLLQRSSCQCRYMSEKRQHYLPQFLQRGFASASDRARTWYYRRRAIPKEVGIRDVGVEDYFYSDSSNTTPLRLPPWRTGNLVVQFSKYETGNPGQLVRSTCRSCSPISKFAVGICVRDLPIVAKCFGT